MCCFARRHLASRGPLTELGPERIGRVDVAPRAHAVFTPLFNHALMPAISIPVAWAATVCRWVCRSSAAEGAIARARPRGGSRARSSSARPEVRCAFCLPIRTPAKASPTAPRCGRKVAAPGTALVPLTAPRGLPYIASRAEAQIGGTIVLEMLAEHHRSADGAVIAAFGDPGLFGARELFDIPVIGMSEAAMLTACMLGRSSRS